MNPSFRDRLDAGLTLAKALQTYKNENPIIVALPRGGVVLGAQVAKALGAQLDIIPVRKLGAPSQPELALGAIALGGAKVLNQDLIEATHTSLSQLETVVEQEEQELQRRAALYRPGMPALDVAGRTVILVDDGLATGATARAAIVALKQMNPKKIVLALPVCAAETAMALRHEVDELLCLQVPEPFGAVGCWYKYFDQVNDDEVIALLAEARQTHWQRQT